MYYHEMPRTVMECVSSDQHIWQNTWDWRDKWGIRAITGFDPPQAYFIIMGRWGHNRYDLNS